MTVAASDTITQGAPEYRLAVETDFFFFGMLYGELIFFNIQ
jgi:hypothetical protein